MVNTKHVLHKAYDRSYFAILKKEIHALAVSGNFSDHKVGEIDIIVSEIVSNLVKHAGGGDLLVKLIEENNLKGIEIISIDNGPGMTDISRMVADGVSTKNTLGHGLGAIKRLSDVFQVYSQKDWGTVILSRVFEDEPPSFLKASKIEVKSILVSKPGEQVCGDGFFYTANNEYVRLFLGDGLGHGPEAAYAVQEAGNAFIGSDETDPCEMIRVMNGAAKKTRGLVGSVAILDIKASKWKVCGVGNISSKFFGENSFKNHMSYNGIIGLNTPTTLNAQEVDSEKGQHLVMCSDGIKSRWDPTKYPAIFRYDKTIFSAALLKDFARHTDDMSVVVCNVN